MNKKSKFLVGLGSSVALLATPVIGCSSSPDAADEEPVEIQAEELEESEADCGAEGDCGAKDEAEAGCGAEGGCGAADEDDGEEGGEDEAEEEAEAGCGAEGGCGT